MSVCAHDPYCPGSGPEHEAAKDTTQPDLMANLAASVEKLLAERKARKDSGR